MKLLPAGSGGTDEMDDMGSASRFQMEEAPPTRNPYVYPGYLAPILPLFASSPARPDACASVKTPLDLNSALLPQPAMDVDIPMLPPKPIAKVPSIAIVEPEEHRNSGTLGRVKDLTWSTIGLSPRAAPGATEEEDPNPPITVPPAALPCQGNCKSPFGICDFQDASKPRNSSRSTKKSVQKKHSMSLEAISEKGANIPGSISVSPTRPMPQRYHRLHQRRESVASRPGSSLSQHPSIPPLATSTIDAPQYSSRPSSPIGPWTPSHGSDWTRPPAPPSRTGSNYEPVDLNGSPRPGTPSSRYGGSPRRPLPLAPLFTGSKTGSGVIEASIDLGDGNNDDDVFGGGGRTIDPMDDARVSLGSRESFLSESTVVTDEKDETSKAGADDNDDETQKFHYGPAPEGKQSRRGVRPAQVSKREVQLINGELVLECKIPTILYSFLPRRDEREFTDMRYTAVTCDPDDFVLKGYKLRQNIGSTMRETELFICVTMYNENEILFTRTMHGIMRNISHFCSRTKSRTWGKDGWQKIVVCIIADGRQKVHPRTLNALAAMGVYQEGIAKNMVNQKEVTAHVYEYTTQVSLDSDLKFKGAEKGIVPCQVIFCLKEQNQKKLNSHRWFFNAFGRALEPNVCILLDVGTKPAPTALYHLWKAFDQDSNVAGAAGEIIASKGKGWLGLFNPLIASQNFEYKMSNILDKPLESVFGYITVLPGALSAYRYYALLNDETGYGPLNQYFKGETLHGKDADVFTANMYLAEDRILCWELVAKRGERWVLKFVKSAVGETDVPGEYPCLFFPFVD